jgi:hypothetical protein
MAKKAWFSRPFFYIVVILYAIFTYTTLAWGPKWAAILFPEDHYFEDFGTIGLFLAAGVAFYTFIRAFHHRQVLQISTIKLLAILALGLWFFFMGGEEISWGQRIFHIQEPASLASANTQGELNLHNLAALQHNPILNFDHIFTLFWFLYALIIPLVARYSERFRSFIGRYLPIVGIDIGLLFLLNYILAQIARPLFSSHYTYQPLRFAQALMQVKEGIAEPLCAVIAINILWQINQALAKTRPASTSSDNRRAAASNGAPVDAGPAR